MININDLLSKNTELFLFKLPKEVRIISTR